MDLQMKFSDESLECIAEEASIYMCACPGQVAVEIRQLRNLIRYQRDCQRDKRNNPQTHAVIEASALEAHRTMERCLDQILEIEGWDRSTLKMPIGLRQVRDALINDPV